MFLAKLRKKILEKKKYGKKMKQKCRKEGEDIMYRK